MMKKITFLVVALVLGATTIAQTITQNNSQVLVDGLGLTCQSSGVTTDNQLSGVFDLTNDFGITTAWAVNEVQFGVDEVLNAPGDVYPVVINVYTTDSGDPNGNLVLLGSQTSAISSTDELSVVSVPFATPAVVPAGAVIVVELAVLNDGVTGFRLGATDVASNDDSWILAADCGATTAATYASLGFADRWMVLNVVGTDASGVEELAEFVSVYPNPANNVLNISIDTSLEVKSATLFDVLGKNTGVQSVNGSMDVSNLSKGVYILSIETTSGNISQKVVKQ